MTWSVPACQDIALLKQGPEFDFCIVAPKIMLISVVELYLELGAGPSLAGPVLARATHRRYSPLGKEPGALVQHGPGEESPPKGSDSPFE